MKMFETEMTREADAYTILKEPISSIDLMERAAERATLKLNEIYPDRNEYIVFAGPGNNGGDGLAMARILSKQSKKVRVCIVKFTEIFSSDFQINLDRLIKAGSVIITEIYSMNEFPKIQKNEIVIDALFGSGLKRSISGFPGQVVDKINTLENKVVSVDIPSGLFGEDNPLIPVNVLKAEHTITFQYPKLSFMFRENEEYVGTFHVIDIGIHPDFLNENCTSYYYTTQNDIVLKKRKKFSHKGNYGHVLVFAGSEGKAGASILVVRALHRIGTGLVSAVVPVCNYDILHISSPETMTYYIDHPESMNQLPDISMFNVMAIGPGIGIGSNSIQFLTFLIKNSTKPIVIDADAITILSKNRELLEIIPQGSILTPHPKEFERLTGECNTSHEMLKKQIEFSKNYGLIVVLKGAHTSITTPEGDVYFNSCGNPGMATAGSGDVLTGIIAGLLAQSYEPVKAAQYGVFMHGLAGDYARERFGQNSLIASDIITCLPEVFKNLE